MMKNTAIYRSVIGFSGIVCLYLFILLSNVGMMSGTLPMWLSSLCMTACVLSFAGVIACIVVLANSILD